MARHKRASTANAPTETPAALKRETIMSPHFVSIYTNDIQAQTSAWDMRLIFGEIAETATAESPVLAIRQLADVRMSPQLAKRLVMIMASQLSAYEERFGKIPETEKA